MILRFFSLYYAQIIELWEDIDEITDFVESLSFDTIKEFEKKHGKSGKIIFKTKKENYEISFKTSGFSLFIDSITKK